MADRACMAIINNNQILLVKQSYKDKIIWTMPGGSIHENETPEEAAVRESKEEVKLNTKVIKLLYSGKRTTGIGYYYCFLGEIISGKAALGSDPELPADGQELMELKWWDIEQVKEYHEISRILPSI